MTVRSANLFINFLFSLCMALPLGVITGNIYLAIHKGFNLIRLRDMALTDLWEVSPFVQGVTTDKFMMAMSVVGITSSVATLLLVIFLSYKPNLKNHGTARWGCLSQMKKAGYFQKFSNVSGPIFGKSTSPKKDGLYLTNSSQPHSLVVAPTRAGKGVGVVIPTLLTFNGSVIALDVKGELFELTSRFRQSRGDRVFKFSPLDKEGRTHCYNPVLDVAAAPSERRFIEARRLASNLIVSKSKGADGFIDGARDLFVAGILAVIERGNPTIGAVYDLFALPGEKYKLFAALAKESNIPEVKRIFDNMASNDTKIITSYTSVLADGGLNLWADQLIKNATSRSDFSIYDLRKDPTTIYLCVSPNDLEVVAPLVRLFFQQVVSVMQREIPEKDEVFEVLFLLDEFKHLGKMEAVETAITTIAGYNGRFMFIVQSLSALTSNYEQSGKENFLGNTGVQVFMATADDETPQYISKAIGEYTFHSKTKSWSRMEMLDTNIQRQEQGTSLIRPEQIRLLDDDTQIVLIKGNPPLKMPKTKYYADRVLKKLYEGQKGPFPEPDPFSEIDIPTKNEAPSETPVDDENPSDLSFPAQQPPPPLPKHEEPVLDKTPMADQEQEVMEPVLSVPIDGAPPLDGDFEPNEDPHLGDRYGSDIDLTFHEEQELDPVEMPPIQVNYDLHNSDTSNLADEPNLANAEEQAVKDDHEQAEHSFKSDDQAKRSQKELLDKIIALQGKAGKTDLKEQDY